MTEKTILSRAEALKLATEILSKSPYEIAVMENGRASCIEVIKKKNIIFCTIFFGGFRCDEACGQMVVHPAFGHKAEAFADEIKSLLPVVEITEAVAESKAVKTAKEKRTKALKKPGDYQRDYHFGAADEESF